jgi:hypothetical protein
MSTSPKTDIHPYNSDVYCCDTRGRRNGAEAIASRQIERLVGLSSHGPQIACTWIALACRSASSVVSLAVFCVSACCILLLSNSILPALENPVS